MKPYSFDIHCSKTDVGCCPGHDWPRCYRWVGKYGSTASKRKSAALNKRAKRRRRRCDKYRLTKELAA